MHPFKIRILQTRKPFRLLLIFSLVLALGACAAGQSSSSTKRLGDSSDSHSTRQGSSNSESYTSLCRVDSQLFCNKHYEMQVGEDCACSVDGMFKSGEAAPE